MNKTSTEPSIKLPSDGGMESHGPPGHGAAISLAFLSISFPLLLLQFSTLPIFLYYENYRRNVCFRILFTNGVTDCIQLTTIIIYAIMNLMPNEISKSTQKIGGAIMINIFCLVVFQHLLLAINRLIMVLRGRFLGAKFWCDPEREAFLFNIAHVLVWLLYIGNVVLFLSPFAGALFDPAKSSFYYDESLPYTGIVHNAAFYVVNGVPAICFLIYASIIWIARKSRKQTQRNSESVSSSNTGQAALSETEQKLLVQAIILYTIMTSLIIGWKFDWGLPVEAQAVFFEIPYLIFCGLNPILYLSMNIDFRKRFTAFYTEPFSKRGSSSNNPVNVTTKARKPSPS